MKVELKIDKDIMENKVIVSAKELNEDIINFVNRLKEFDETKIIIGFLEEKTFLLEKNEIESIYTENSRVYARIKDKKYKLKYKLYELEEILKGTSFVRISNSEIANFNKVESMDVKGSSVIILKFKSGQVTYVSRRYVRKIKEYLKI